MPRKINTIATRILEAKQKVGNSCPYCSGEYGFHAGSQIDTIIVVCKKCGGRKKNRLDGQGNAMPPTEVVIVLHF